MRLFTAIDLGLKEKLKLNSFINELKAIYPTASFTKMENLHMTLKFLGEVEKNKISGIIKAIENASFSTCPFEFHSAGIKILNKEVLTLVIKGSKPLDLLYSSLEKGLVDCGFKAEERTFFPHITLARRVGGMEVYNDMEAAFKADGITLFQSVRIKGELIYKAYTKRNLQNITNNS